MNKKILSDQCAAVIVDMQNDFLAIDGALKVEGTEEEINTIGNTNILAVYIRDFIQKMFLERKRLYFTTEDFHSQNHVEFGTFPPHCIRDTEGAKYHTSLKHIYSQATDNLIKGYDPEIFSYSVSTSDEFKDHIRLLRRNNIEDIILCGVAYNFCVGESAIAYAMQGFNTFVINDLTMSVPVEKSIKDMDEKLGIYSVNIINKDNIKSL